MKVYKVLMFFTPTSDPHAPYYFLQEDNIEPYLEPIKEPFPEFGYTVEEEEYNSISEIPSYPMDSPITSSR
jgi:hypothetical protein